MLSTVKDLVLTDIHAADSVSNLAYHHALILANDSLIAKSYMELGRVGYFKSNYGSALEYYKKALATNFYKKNLTARQALFNNLGVVNEFQHNYKHARDAYIQSVDIARRIGDSTGVYQSYINLGLLSSFEGHYREAETYLFSALKYFQESEDAPNEILSLRNIFNNYVNAGEEEAAVRYFNLTLDKIGKYGTDLDALDAQLDYNWALLKFERFVLLKKYQDIIRPLATSEKASETQKANFYFLEGVYQMRSNNSFIEADKALERAYFIFKAQKNTRQSISVQEYRLELSARTGNLAKHGEIMADIIELLKENYTIVHSNEIKAMESLHQLDMQALQIEQLNNAVDRERTIKWLLIALLALSLAAIAIALRGYRIIRRQQGKINLKNRDLAELVHMLRARLSERGMPDEEIDAMSNRLDAIEYGIQRDLSEQGPASENPFYEDLFGRLEQIVVAQQGFLTQDLKITDVAGVLGVHEREISKAINDLKGQRFTSYINHYRIEHAKTLLLQHADLSVKEVAFKSGFSNQPQFQRKFKELTGLTPEQFRYRAQDPLQDIQAEIIND